MSDETEAGLTKPDAADFTEAGDPFRLFETWMAKAADSEVNDPTAMALATVDADGMPNVRMVLLKGADATGFVFYTNTESAKGGELLASGKAALCFHWKSLRRQVRVRGAVTPVDDAEARRLFRLSARAGSQIGAWASRQSRPLESRVRARKGPSPRWTAKHAVGTIPRPPHWTGFRLVPSEIEFWHDRTFRLHDRIRFTRQTPDGAWHKERLYP